MTQVILDAGALVGFERSDRDVALALQVARAEQVSAATSAMIIARAWRDPGGRQAILARLLDVVDEHLVDEASARAAGILLGRSATSDAVDAVLVLLAQDGDRILTSDPDDIRHLVSAAGRRVTIVPC